MNRFLLFVILFVFGVMWGSTIPLTKIAVSTGHHSFGLIFWQTLIGAIILAVIMVVRRSRLVIDKRHLIFFTVISLTGTLVPNTTSFLAAFHLPGGVMALIIALVPMFSLLVALTFRLERFEPVRLAGIIFGAIAIALLVLPDSSLPDPTKAVFVLVALVAPFCYGIEGNYLAVQQPSDTGPVATLFGGYIVATVLVVPLTFMTGTFIDPRSSGIGWPEIALIVSSFLHIGAYVGYIWMVGKAGAVFSAQVAYIVTPAGIVTSMLVLGETPSPYIWLALLLLLTGLFLVQPRPKVEASQQA